MIVFFTDPHLGLRRQAHATPTGLVALRERLYQAVQDVIDRYPTAFKVCAGDWLDKAHNDEQTLLRSYGLACEVDLIEAGNHDMENNVEAVTTLMAIKTLLDNDRDRVESVIAAPFNRTKVKWSRHDSEGLNICMVPHHSTQDLFELALQEAVQEAEEFNDGNKRILILHCNYDSPFATHDTSLNLTEDDAEFLLEHFDYVLLGHEHQPRDLHQGRLIILGNTHPTSFADISEKRVAIWENGELRFETIWDPKGRYLKLHHSALESADFSQAEFVHVHGEVGNGELLGIMRKAKALTKGLPNLFLLRMDLTTAALERVERDMNAVKMTLPQRIEAELEKAGDEESLALWRELVIGG